MVRLGRVVENEEEEALLGTSGFWVVPLWAFRVLGARRVIRVRAGRCPDTVRRCCFSADCDGQRARFATEPHKREVIARRS